MVLAHCLSFFSISLFFFQKTNRNPPIHAWLMQLKPLSTNPNPHVLSAKQCSLTSVSHPAFALSRSLALSFSYSSQKGREKKGFAATYINKIYEESRHP